MNKKILRGIIMVVGVLLLLAVYNAAMKPVTIPEYPTDTTSDNAKDFTENEVIQPTIDEELLNREDNSGGTVYVSTDGDDRNDGSRNQPFLTINKAVDSGAETIFVFAGVYRESIEVSRTGGRLEIIAKPLSNDNKDVIIDLSVDVDLEKDSTTGLVKAEYRSDENDLLLKAFVDKTESLIYNDGYMTTGYSCNLWQGDIKMIPVQSMEECLKKENTWYYDGVYLYANAEEGRYQLSDGTKEYGIMLSWFQEVNLTGITVKYAQKDAVRLKGCSNAEISRCSFGYSGLYCGLALESSSAIVRNCEAMFCRADGLNIHGVSTADFIDCVSHNNGDDGISHHDASGGMIIGGEYYNNTKAGIASPTFGSRNEIIGAFVHHNNVGIYAVTSVDGYYPPCSISDCYIAENNIGISSVRYHLRCWNNIFSGNAYDTKEQDGGVVEILQ